MFSHIFSRLAVKKFSISILIIEKFYPETNSLRKMFKYYSRSFLATRTNEIQNRIAAAQLYGISLINILANFRANYRIILSHIGFLRSSRALKVHPVSLIDMLHARTRVYIDKSAVPFLREPRIICSFVNSFPRREEMVSFGVAIGFTQKKIYI